MNQSGDPRRLFDRLIGTSVGLLVAAAALYMAARLVESVWPILLVMIGTVGSVALTIAIIRNHHRGW